MPTTSQKPIQARRAPQRSCGLFLRADQQNAHRAPQRACGGISADAVDRRPQISADNLDQISGGRAMPSAQVIGRGGRADQNGRPPPIDPPVTFEGGTAGARGDFFAPFFWKSAKSFQHIHRYAKICRRRLTIRRNSDILRAAKQEQTRTNQNTRKDGETMKFYTIPEVCELLRAGDSTVRKWIRAGKIETVKPGCRVLISDEALQRFLQERTRPAKPQKK